MTAVVQWNHARCGGRRVPKRMGSTPGRRPGVERLPLGVTVTKQVDFKIGGLL